jgi:hypothetical protein
MMNCMVVFLRSLYIYMFTGTCMSVLMKISCYVLILLYITLKDLLRTLLSNL